MTLEAETTTAVLYRKLRPHLLSITWAALHKKKRVLLGLGAGDALDTLMGCKLMDRSLDEALLGSAKKKNSLSWLAPVLRSISPRLLQPPPISLPQRGNKPSYSIIVAVLEGNRRTYAGWMRHWGRMDAPLEPFGCADKLIEKHCWLICWKRKILFRLKKQAEKYGL